MAEEDQPHGISDQGEPLDNVVRFPRDWFGPIEELIPFGPDCDAEEAARSAAARRTNSSPPRTAEHFWGEPGWDDRNVLAELAEPAPGQRQQRAAAVPASGHSRRTLAFVAIGMIAVLGAVIPRLLPPATPASPSASSYSASVQRARSGSSSTTASITTSQRSSRQPSTVTHEQTSTRTPAVIDNRISASKTPATRPGYSVSSGAAMDSGVEVSNSPAPDSGASQTHGQTDYPQSAAPNPSYATAAAP